MLLYHVALVWRAEGMAPRVFLGTRTMNRILEGFEYC